MELRSKERVRIAVVHLMYHGEWVLWELGGGWLVGWGLVVSDRVGGGENAVDTTRAFHYTHSSILISSPRKWVFFCYIYHLLFFSYRSLVL